MYEKSRWIGGMGEIGSIGVRARVGMRRLIGEFRW